MIDPFLPDFSNFSTLWTRPRSQNTSDTSIRKLLQNEPKFWGLAASGPKSALLLEAPAAEGHDEVLA